ncbi:MAG: class I SAM-dependent methyltransferase [Rhodomicrobium sp.]
MALPAVAQAAYLADTLERLVTDHAPQSVAVIGCAGGNGFDRLAAANVPRVVGVDISAAYLAETKRRYLARFQCLQLVECDIASQVCRFDPADLIFAALIFEYICIAAGLASLRRNVRPGGLVAAVLQLPHPAIAAVTPGPFTSLSKLEPIQRLVAPEQFVHAAKRAGFGLQSNVRRVLSSGKAFQEMLLFPRHDSACP